MYVCMHDACMYVCMYLHITYRDHLDRMGNNLKLKDEVSMLDAVNQHAYTYTHTYTHTYIHTDREFLDRVEKDLKLK